MLNVIKLLNIKKHIYIDFYIYICGMGRQKIINELRLAELQKESEEVVNYLKVEKSINYFRFKNSVNDLTESYENFDSEGYDIPGLINDFYHKLYEKADDNEKEFIIKLVESLKYIAKDYYKNTEEGGV